MEAPSFRVSSFDLIATIRDNKDGKKFLIGKFGREVGEQPTFPPLFAPFRLVRVSTCL
jgi:hypothetical protein